MTNCNINHLNAHFCDGFWYGTCHGLLGYTSQENKDFFKPKAPRFSAYHHKLFFTLSLSSYHGRLTTPWRGENIHRSNK